MLFGGNTATSFAAQDARPVQIASADCSYSDQATQILNYVNDVRAKMGLNPVKLNPFLTKAAENHANYVSTNNMYDHDERSSGKGFTGVSPSDRVLAVDGANDLRPWEIMSYDVTDTSSIIDGFMNTAYHREHLMSPSATEIGFGRTEKVVVIEIFTGDQRNKTLSVYPYNGQTRLRRSG